LLKELIEIANLKIEPDTLLKNVNLVNVFSKEVISTNVALGKEKIAGIGNDYQTGKEVLDLKGKFLLPGLIDGHLHLESSLLSPAEFTKAAVPRGTTSIIIDPHEIANVLGLSGINYVLRATENLPLTFFIMASSCVPATHMETAGATLSASEISKILDEDRVLGLAEFMNFPGVVNAAPEALEKIMAAQNKGKIIDGHAPGLSGPQLQAYLAAGIGSDHECSTPEEALEKLRSGMRIMIREGTAAKNLKDLLPIVTEENSRRCILVSDDLHPDDLINHGHLDRILRKAFSLGFDPLKAVQMLTLNTAEYFGLKGLGAVAPGYFADLVVVDDLENFRPYLVFKRGQIVAKGGRMVSEVSKYAAGSVKNTLNFAPLEPENLNIRDTQEKVKVIGLIPNQIVTEKLLLTPLSENGFINSDTERDILKLAVIERHKKTGNIGLGLIKGLNLKKGALASSVAHDSHNIIVVGTKDDDMIFAVQKLKEVGGGLVVVNKGKVESLLPLPLAGLMSENSLEEVVKNLGILEAAARRLGCTIENPFIALSFCALPVIPELKLTDKGLVDVVKFSIVSLYGAD